MTRLYVKRLRYQDITKFLKMELTWDFGQHFYIDLPSILLVYGKLYIIALKLYFLTLANKV